MDFLGGLLAKLFLGLVQSFLAREDFRARVYAEVKDESTKLALQALEWKARAAAQPDGGSSLRVADGGNERIQGFNPDPPR